MRTRHQLLLFLAAATGFLLLLRHHLRDLSEVARTYATYHQYVCSHPDILYRYPPQEDHVQDTRQQTPKIIHQIFLTDGRNATLSKYQDAVASCRILHPGWTHNLWTDENATTWMREHYPDIAPHYEGYQQSIQRANILRYALLHSYGGVYLDLDVTCLARLDDLLHLPFVTPGAYPAGVNNAFILTRPHHEFLTLLLQHVAGGDLWWPLPYVQNMLSTGCMFFTNRWMSYVRSLDRRRGPVADADRVYTLADAEGNMKVHMLRGNVTTPLFAHAGASSWHGWDAAAIVLIGRHYGYFLMLMMSGVILGVVLGWKAAGYGRSRWRRPTSFTPGPRSIDRRADEERLLNGKEG